MIPSRWVNHRSNELPSRMNSHLSNSMKKKPGTFFRWNVPIRWVSYGSRVSHLRNSFEINSGSFLGFRMKWFHLGESIIDPMNSHLSNSMKKKPGTFFRWNVPIRWVNYGSRASHLRNSFEINAGSFLGFRMKWFRLGESIIDPMNSHLERNPIYQIPWKKNPGHFSDGMFQLDESVMGPVSLICEIHSK
jgi:hypothetical protein